MRHSHAATIKLTSALYIDHISKASHVVTAIDYLSHFVELSLQIPNSPNSHDVSLVPARGLPAAISTR